MAIGAVSVSGLTPAPSPLAAQDIDIVYEDDVLSLTYRKGFGANVAVQMSTDLASWMPIQVQDEVIATDSDGEIVTADLAIDAVPRLFFRLSTAKAWSATLAWDAPSDPSVTGYRLRYGTASKSYTQEIDVGDNTQATIFLSPSKPVCFFVVTAFNAAGLESPPSDELKVAIH